MELIELWKIFRRRWWIILLPPLVVAAIVAPAFLNSPAASGSWTTAVKLIAAQPPSDELPTYEDTSYIPWLASEHLVDGLTDWINTFSFVQEISAGLAERGVDIPAEAMRGITVSDNSRSILQLFVTWPDPDQLQIITEAAIQVLSERNDVYLPQVAAEPVRVIQLDDIVLSPVPPGLTSRFEPVLKVMLAAVVGLGIAALVEYADRSIRERADLETLDIVVIGEIPRHS